MASPEVSGPPYMPPVAQVGLLPSFAPDVPLSEALLALFVVSAAGHMTVFQLNRPRKHKFIFSGLMFGFSMTRIVALILRIVWATQPKNPHIALASAIFTQVGVVIVFIVNLFLAMRVLRAFHPKFGWNPIVRIILKFLVFSALIMIIMLITVSVHMAYTLDRKAILADHDVQLFAGTWLAIIAFLPIPVIILSAILPCHDPSKVVKFGTGRFRTKIRLLLFTSSLLTFGAGFRVGTNYVAPPITEPTWFDSKACYYVLNYGIELIVSFTYLVTRFDQRFHVPDRQKEASTTTTATHGLSPNANDTTRTNNSLSTSIRRSRRSDEIWIKQEDLDKAFEGQRARRKRWEHRRQRGRKAGRGTPQTPSIVSNGP